MKSVIVAVTFALLPAIAIAGPFGIEMGDPVTKYGVARKVNEDFFVLKAVPTPHSEFESYMVFATPQTGICKVIAMGRDNGSDAYGSAVRQDYDDLKLALSKKYGSGKSIEFIRVQSIWDEPRDWAMSLAKNERTHVTYWIKADGAALGGDLDAISLTAKATDSSTTYVTLGYEFTNFDACQKAFKSKDDSAL